ncbi:OmpA family protein [Rickettsiella endosymbiont of Dermanyssus gallinae]|uniref:OmpA family protein n=1 Tax=Rickettsiella endosymbiont of Dermanyssus gallinae TaxID=2856608 RepID=UPI001C530065|nr:OmpA family protein [Rickettsiella endosymbiont of Dermanyssus gallinae]
MMKIKSPFFCSLLLLNLFLLSACSTTPTQSNDDLHAAKVEKITPSANKKQLPPALIQVIQSSDRLRVVLYSDVCFQSNGRLTMECSKQLLDAMKTMKQYGDGLIQVVGYTDDIYDPQTANELSQRQADTVVAFLWSHGIGSRRLGATGFGSHDPIASNQSVKASAANRRVEITLVK